MVDPRTPVGGLAALRFYLGFWKAYRRHLVPMFFFFTVKHGAWMTFPVLVKFMVDSWIPAQRLDLIFASIGIVVLMGLVNMFFHSRFKVLEADLVKNVSREIRQLLVAKLQLLSLGFHAKGESGRFTSKLMIDVERCERFAVFLLNGLWGTAFTLVYAVAILAVVEPRILLLYLGTVPVYLVVYRLFRRRFSSLQHEARIAQEDLSQSIQHFIQTGPLARMYGEEDYERAKVNERGVSVVDRQKGLSRSIGVFQVLSSSLGQVFLVTILAFCSLAIIKGLMTVGALLLFLQYGNQMIHSLQGVLEQFPIFTEFGESIASIREILSSDEEEVREGRIRLDPIRGELAFRGVEFAYPGAGGPVLRNLDLEIPAGASVGLVGPSGSGKTTMIQLALGLLRPRSGSVLLDGHSLDELDLRAFRHRVGVVTQDPLLFRGTVRENIAYARESVTRERIEDAARLANADGFIRSMPKGYDTLVGERGVTLSGGQKQRIVIARALLRRPALLILDEATSALDAESEREVQKGIDLLLGRQTTILIAHRLSTLFRCDRILVFDGGRIAESGTHAELVRLRGLYAGLLSTQLGIPPEGLDALLRAGRPVEGG